MNLEPVASNGSGTYTLVRLQSTSSKQTYLFQRIFVSKSEYAIPAMVFNIANLLHMS